MHFGHFYQHANIIKNREVSKMHTCSNSPAAESKGHPLIKLTTNLARQDQGSRIEDKF